MVRKILAVLAGAALMIVAFPASASIKPPCGPYNGATSGTCGYNPSIPPTYNVDFTVPPDGTEEQWDFWLDNADPNAAITLEHPNQVEGTFYYADAPTVPVFFQGVQGYLWTETSSPGHLSIIVRGPANWNDCGEPGANGICGVEYRIWGNDTLLNVDSSLPGTLHWSETTLAVPEPATWAMMLVGFFGLGVMLRRRLKSPLRRVKALLPQ